MVFQCINICQVPWEWLKTTAFGLGFQHLPWDLVNVNAWKTMFDPYIKRYFLLFIIPWTLPYLSENLNMLFYNLFFCIKMLDEWQTRIDPDQIPHSAVFFLVSQLVRVLWPSTLLHSVNLLTFFPKQLKSSWAHTLTDNSPSWTRGRGEWFHHQCP